MNKEGSFFGPEKFETHTALSLSLISATLGIELLSLINA